MFEPLFKMLKSVCLNGRRAPVLTRDSPPRVLSSEARRELKRLQQGSDEGSAIEEVDR